MWHEKEGRLNTNNVMSLTGIHSKAASSCGEKACIYVE